MPPPMPNASKRITANPVRPARYRPGKAVPEDDSSDEEEEEEDDDEKPQQAQKTTTKARSRPLQKSRTAAQPVDEDDDDDEEGFVTDEEEEITVSKLPTTSAPSQITKSTRPISQARIPPAAPAAPAAQVDPKPKLEDSEESESASGSESDEEESSEAESSSEDEAPRRKFQRPIFIKKADRQKPPGPSASESKQNEIPSLAASSTPEVDEQARRLAQADLYIKDKIERDAIARAQGKKAWDDDEELAPEDMVDDRDGLDPEAEHAAWKVRELKRVKRDREVIEAREKEIEEIERRRNLTREEREREDREHLERQKEDRDAGRSKANYLTKYHHKGAFFQDDEVAELLKKRDVMGARFEDEVADKSALPEYMRVRDMNKLGKKGRTRYTDLKGEDTGRFGEQIRKWKGSGYEGRDGSGGYGGGQDLRGVDERFLPDRDRQRGPTGANASTVGRRNEGRNGGRDEHDPRPRFRSRSGSRSRSPPSRRKRSSSPRHDDRDKRRRIES